MIVRALCCVLSLVSVGAAQRHPWSFVAPVRPRLPAVERPGWDRHPVDAFVLARMAAAGLEPSRQADDAALVRRLSLDLTGLPATSEDLAFLRSQPADVAWERLVDRKLAEPAHAERMAAVWLDLARYADSAGYGSDPLRTIWRYRDWVIEAYEQGMPFDRFTELQIAGDLLPGATWRERLPTAFHRNTKTNTEGGTDDEEFRVEAVRDRVDTTMQVWMGVTFGCAKCHDHKYDPFTMREYYQLFDVFNQTADTDRNDEAPRIATPTREQERELAELDAEITALREGLAERAGALAPERRAWEGALRERDEGWIPLAPSSLESSAGNPFEVDGSGFAIPGGDAAERDTYTFEAGGERRVFRSLRLELATGPERESVGRAPGNGNVVVSELRVGLRREGEEPVRGRYVRIELPGNSRILSLAEVEVDDPDGRNVALGGVARQSSVDYGGDAERAIDGLTSGDFEEGSVTHTLTEADPWWEVDLLEVRRLTDIRVWNRTGGDLPGRLRGFAVRVLDDERRVTWSSTPRDLPAPSLGLDLVHGLQWRAPLRATASFEQDGWGVAMALDGDGGTGWAVSPRQREPQQAVFAFEPALTIEADEILRVEIEQGYGTHHVIQRFGLSIHAEDPPALPVDVARALAVVERDRTQAQREHIDAYYATVDPGLATIRARIAAVERKRARLDVVETPVLVELSPEQRRETHLLLRGSFLSKGDRVDAAVPASLHPAPGGAELDRLALARWLVDRRNPMTARVQVNRLWARIFGTGLVATEEDFGSQGERPSHPELLDWLAVEFMDNGWDVRHVLKTIVTSATYRQAALADARQLDVDPYGRLLARSPRVRLEAEMVRDQALALAGLLSDRRYGWPVYPPQPEGLWQAAFNGSDRRWVTSKGEDRHRRAIYTFLRRSSPYPSMTTFDAPTREICTARRIRTNTPLQAFVTLNDPVFHECAQALARRIVREGGSAPGERVRWALRTCLLRDPAAREAAVLEGLFEGARTHWDGRADDAVAFATEPLGPLADGEDPVELAAWTAVASVLLNLDAVLTKP